MANPCRSCGCATADQPPAGASRSTSQARAVTRTPSYRPDSQPARAKTPSTPLVASTWATQPPGPDPRRTYGRDHLACWTGFPGVGEAVGSGAGFDDLSGEGQAVHDRGTESRVGECLCPRGEGLVGGDRNR